MPLKRGNSVCIKNGLYSGHTGEVMDIITMQTNAGLSELVWVKLLSGRVDGFSPASLEKLTAFAEHQAA